MGHCFILTDRLELKKLYILKHGVTLKQVYFQITASHNILHCYFIVYNFLS